MDLKIKDVADLFNVAESTVRKWILDGKIPSYRIHQQHYFSRTEIENWVISQNKCEEDSIFHHIQRECISSDRQHSSQSNGNRQFCLFRALHKGDVLQHIHGSSKKEIIQSCMHRMSKLIQTDVEVMIEMLLDRENLMSTAIGNGIAVPHTRESLLNAHHDIVIGVCLDEPLEFGALDGLPVHTLFFLFACEDKRHLQLLAKIAHFSKQPHLMALIKAHPSKKQLLNAIKDWEATIPSY